MKEQSDSVSKREYWADQFERQEASGLSQREYCRREGINFSGFHYWKVKDLGLKRESTRIVRLPVNLGASSSTAVEVLVGGRFTVRVGCDVDEQHLLRVLRSLESLR